MDINNELTWLLIVHYLILQSRFFIQTPFCTEVGVQHALVRLSSPVARALSVELFSTARAFHSSLSREQFQTVKHGGAAAVT